MGSVDHLVDGTVNTFYSPHSPRARHPPPLKWIIWVLSKTSSAQLIGTERSFVVLWNEQSTLFWLSYIVHQKNMHLGGMLSIELLTSTEEYFFCRCSVSSAGYKGCVLLWGVCSFWVRGKNSNKRCFCLLSFFLALESSIVTERPVLWWSPEWILDLLVFDLFAG